MRIGGKRRGAGRPKKPNKKISMTTCISPRIRKIVDAKVSQNRSRSQLVEEAIACQYDFWQPIETAPKGDVDEVGFLESGEYVSPVSVLLYCPKLYSHQVDLHDEIVVAYWEWNNPGVDADSQNGWIINGTDIPVHHYYGTPILWASVVNLPHVN